MGAGKFYPRPVVGGLAVVGRGLVLLIIFAILEFEKAEVFGGDADGGGGGAGDAAPTVEETTAEDDLFNHRRHG